MTALPQGLIIPLRTFLTLSIRFTLTQIFDLRNVSNIFDYENENKCKLREYI